MFPLFKYHINNDGNGDLCRDDQDGDGHANVGQKMLPT